MNWIALIIAGLFETGFAFCLGKAKYAAGSEAMWWYTGFLICISLSMYFLYIAIKTIPIGTAYAIWTGIGAAGIVVMGILFLKEPVDFWRLFFIGTLIGSIIGLKYVSL